MARWLRCCIHLAYRARGEEPPEGVTAHSLRSVATSAAHDGYSSLVEIYQAATSASVHLFTRHYQVDVGALVSMGRRVLQ